MSEFYTIGTVCVAGVLLLCIALLILVMAEDDTPPAYFKHDEDWLE